MTAWLHRCSTRLASVPRLAPASPPPPPPPPARHAKAQHQRPPAPRDQRQHVRVRRQRRHVLRFRRVPPVVRRCVLQRPQHHALRRDSARGVAQRRARTTKRPAPPASATRLVHPLRGSPEALDAAVALPKLVQHHARHQSTLLCLAASRLRTDKTTVVGERPRAAPSRSVATANDRTLFAVATAAASSDGHKLPAPGHQRGQQSEATKGCGGRQEPVRRCTRVVARAQAQR